MCNSCKYKKDQDTTKAETKEIKQRSPEMEELIKKSKERSKIFRTEKTDEALENFREVERQRYKQYYKENRAKEIERVNKTQKTKGLLTCTCGLEITRRHMFDHWILSHVE